MAVETLPVAPREHQPLVLTPQQAEELKTGLQRSTQYVNAPESVQKEFDMLSPEEVSKLPYFWMPFIPDEENKVELTLQEVLERTKNGILSSSR